MVDVINPHLPSFVNFYVGTPGIDKFNGTSDNDNYTFDSVQNGDVINGFGGEDHVVLDLSTSATRITSGGNLTSLFLFFDGLNLKMYNTEHFTIEASLYDDEITLLAGHDTVYAGFGDDTIYGGDGNDILFGGVDNDHLFGDAGTDILHGDIGDDELTGGEGADELHGGGGSDTLYADTLDTVVTGGFGYDRLYLQYRGNATATFDLAASSIEWAQGSIANDILTAAGKTGRVSLFGGSGDDQLSGGENDDTIHGQSGADSIWGNGGKDELFGGIENDLIYGGTGADKIYGQHDDDRLYGDGGNDQLWGGEGRDYLYGNGGNDFIKGEEGQDFLSGGAGDDTVAGGSDNDTIYGGAGIDNLYGGTGNDIIYAESIDAGLNGGDGSFDTLIAIAGSGGFNRELEGFEKIYLTDFDDTVSIVSASYTVRLFAGDGNDFISGANGVANWILGQGGDDILHGGTQGDLIYGGVGQDEIYGKDGNDKIYGGDGDDYINGGDGAGRLFGQNGNDFIETGNGYSFVRGGNGDDTIIGATARTVFGDAGDDYIEITNSGGSFYGGTGHDIIIGGLGINNLYGGSGAYNDTLTGGGGYDFFHFRSAWGHDIITDFEFWDVIDFTNMAVNSLSDLNIYQSGLDTIIEFGTDSITLQNFDMNGLDRHSFRFEDLPEGYGYIVLNNSDNWRGDYGTTGSEVILGYGGDDIIYGYSWNPYFGWETSNSDIIYGGDGNDEIRTSIEDDELFGDAGNDILFGDQGNDLLVGGTGNDQLIGGQHADTFLFNTGHGMDEILDFEDTQDLIHMVHISFFSELTIYQDGSDVLISYGTTDSIRITNEFIANIGEADFIFGA